MSPDSSSFHPKQQGQRIKQKPKQQQQQQNVLLIGLEFVEPIFSGNGILTHNVVHGLIRMGHNVTVLCARPIDNYNNENIDDNDNDNDNNSPELRKKQIDSIYPPLFQSEDVKRKLCVLPISVPSSKWKRLDRHSAWKEMAVGAVSHDIIATLRKKQKKKNAVFGPFHKVLCVDWTAHPTRRSLERSGLLLNVDGSCCNSDSDSDTNGKPKVVNLVFRVFSRSKELHLSSGGSSSSPSSSSASVSSSCAHNKLDGEKVHEDQKKKLSNSNEDDRKNKSNNGKEDSNEHDNEDDDGEFYRKHEINAMKESKCTIVISHVDMKELQYLWGKGGEWMEKEKKQQLQIHILVPPLRNDVFQLLTSEEKVMTSSSSSPTTATNTIIRTKRNYILCNVRLSPEKNAMAYAKLIRYMYDFNNSIFHEYTPVLIGAPCDPNYASQVVDILPRETMLIQDFLPPCKLLSYLRRAAILIHPPTYDAYGMIVAEAAAVGTPSMIHTEGIGASSLFNAANQEIIMANMNHVESAALKLMELLLMHSHSSSKERIQLRDIGEKTRQKSLMWTLEDYALEFDSIICSNE